MTTNTLTKENYLEILRQLITEREQAREAKLYATELALDYNIRQIKKQLENA